MGATRAQSALIGGAVNPALNVVEIGGIHALLDAADYESIAAQYQPFDPVNLAVASITGAAFGAAFHRGRPGAPKLNPDEHAAALTLHEARVRDGDALVRADNLEAANAAREVQIVARQQLDNGEAVSVAHRVPADGERIDAALRRVADTPVREAFDEVRAVEAAALPTEGAMPTMPPDAPAPVPDNSPVGRFIDTVARIFSPEDADSPARPARQADTPEQSRAFEIAARDPGAVVRTEDGDVRVADLLNAADDLEARARTDSAAFEAAINCALRFPQ